MNTWRFVPVCWCVVFVWLAAVAPIRAVPVASAQVWVVIDGETGQLLMEHGAADLRAMGPLAYLALAYTAVQNTDPMESVLISGRATAQPGMRLGLRRGNDVTVEQLLQALLFTGATDAARALIEHVSGSETAFARLAQHLTREAGAVEMQLPALLTPGIGQLATAYDVALLARAVVLHPVLGPIVQTRRASMEVADEIKQLLNTNSFLWRYPGAVGVLSGYSDDAGYVIAAAAVRGSAWLVAVVMGAMEAEDRAGDVQTILDYAFRHRLRLLETPSAEALPYTVQPGQTLQRIAEETGVDLADILRRNGLADPNQLAAGTRLWLPVATPPVSP